MKRSCAVLVATCIAIALVVPISCSSDDAKEVEEAAPVKAEPAPEVQPEIELPVGFGAVTDNRVRVRTEPGTHGDSIGHLYVRDIVEIFERTPEPETIGDLTAPWIRIRTAFGLFGWAFGAYVNEIDEETYRTTFRRLSIATINLPWEPGSVTEEDIRDGIWGPECGKVGMSIDFEPAATDPIVGYPLILTFFAGETRTLSGAWRVKNGYLVTEVFSQESLHRSASKYIGFTLWDLETTDTSLYVERILRVLQREDTETLYDAGSRLPEGLDRRIGNRIVQTAGLVTYELGEDTVARSTPDADLEPIEFRITGSNGKTKLRKNLPTGQAVVLIARYDSWFYVDTMLLPGDDGPKFAWIRVE